MTGASRRRQRLNKVRVGPCFYCGCEVIPPRGGATKETNWATATVEHIIPKKAGGTDTLGNVVCACKYCNNYKDNAERGLMCHIPAPVWTAFMKVSQRHIDVEDAKDDFMAFLLRSPLLGEVQGRVHFQSNSHNFINRLMGIK